MTLSIIAFTIGVLCLQWQAQLPAAALLATLAAVGVLALGLGRWRPRLRALAPLGALLLGFAWAGTLAQQRLDEALAADLEGRDLQVVGVVASLPQAFDNGWRFDFAPEPGPGRAELPRRLSLAWYRGFRPQDKTGLGNIPELHAGERWQLTLRLKRPHGNLNPGGFDYEAWLFERGVRATGYVRPAPDNRRLAAFVPSLGSWIERLRENVRQRFQATLGPQRPYAGVLVALAVGDQNAIDNGLWQSFARTGLTHLMSISGLHITLVASLVYGAVGWLWRRSPHLPLRLPAQQAAALGGFLGAWVYCLLAGFAVPAQRTLYMLGVAAAALCLRRPLAPRQVLALALLLVLLIDPWAVLAAGFWLSFGAVALLFLVGSGRLHPGHWLRQWGRAQWAMTAGMLPLLLALFQQFSLVSPLANGVAIPLISFVVTPLALLAAVPGLEWLLYPAHWIMELLMIGVEWLARAPWAVWQQHQPPLWALLLALPGIVWLLLPRGFPARWVGAVLLLPLFLAPPARPLAGEAAVTVLDVGQGLAVHVQTASHDLLFDTGPAYSPDANSGNRVILPYLRAIGVQRLDRMVISHEDKDHAGGAESVLESVPVGDLLSSLPFEHDLSAQALPQRPCLAGEHWRWDGIEFAMLHPSAADYARPTGKTNDLSCVLRLTTPHGSLLLSADIEARSEAGLVARLGAGLRTDVLLVPHHGSRTSSSATFLAAVAPRQAVIPVGYRNRFGHPKADVLARYGDIPLHRTDRDGAVEIFFRQGGIEVGHERQRRRRYWHGL
ncbi:DNA internalization-related competence protein ComEC/Rec2 [Denitratisoma sp. DHT3]|uniref:DNA internalization-related competence protein ComEC/Rec2 n=1 Tax=Denitratisoma sp. DHT3 TaxID=1981880 RepID=UPI00119862C6|nr:DNA internalization-related competence protein ComEC/Rec2 [Denitratisoma sp. DHT3]QDX80348.1 DNA internalization-related competence protein ComEC/Rec2 [Denitratisoma sp. DHT3]